VAEPLSSDAAPAVEKPAGKEEKVAAEGKKSGDRRFRVPVRHRFGIAYLVLAAMVGASVGLFIVVLDRSGSNGPPWSAFRPKAHGQATTAEIARYVGSHYKLPSGNQMVSVLARPPVIDSGGNEVPVSAIAIQSAFPDQQLGVYRTKGSIFYFLCGDGRRCSISEGKPTVARAQLLRREGLELALYTFKYVGDVNSVLAFIPPPPGQAPQALIFFRRSDLSPELSAPLTQTLPQQGPFLPGELNGRERRVIAELTGSRTYGFEYRQIQDGTVALFLRSLQA
jgi:hypothetical protein